MGVKLGRGSRSREGSGLGRGRNGDRGCCQILPLPSPRDASGCLPSPKGCSGSLASNPALGRGGRGSVWMLWSPVGSRPALASSSPNILLDVAFVACPAVVTSRREVCHPEVLLHDSENVERTEQCGSFPPLWHHPGGGGGATSVEKILVISLAQISSVWLFFRLCESCLGLTGRRSPGGPNSLMAGS